ncbi:MAG TPA: hypothetical protein VFW38_08255 [Solirubrobacteraceae bacterium]|nr:hypothetical protein [Solirubrobacteraceae bacterium]
MLCAELERPIADGDRQAALRERGPAVPQRAQERVAQAGMQVPPAGQQRGELTVRALAPGHHSPGASPTHPSIPRSPSAAMIVSARSW